MLETRPDRMAAGKVTETLNRMPDAEDDEIADATRHERSWDRKAYRGSTTIGA
jgi:hypothetical protein